MGLAMGPRELLSMTIQPTEAADIIHVTSPAQVGGTITSTLRQAAAQGRAGRSIVVWSAVQRHSEEVPLLAKRYGVECLQQSRLMLAARLAGLRLQRKSGVVHLHSGRGNASTFSPWLKALVPRRYRVVVTLHGTSDFEDWTVEHRRAIHRSNLHGIAAIGVPSPYERERQMELGIEAERVFVLPDPVLSAKSAKGQLRRQLNIPDNADVVVFCGRLTPHKGVGVLLDAFKKWIGTSGVHLVIAGDGPLRDECDETSKHNPGLCHVLGHIEDVGPLYSDADVYVSPSKGESFGISAMEAGLAGVPMVLTEIRPWTDVFKDRRDCLFVPRENSSALAEAVMELLGNPTMARRLGDQAQTTLRHNYSESAFVEALDRMYAFAMSTTN